MTMIPAFGPWTEHPADTDEEKRLASAQQSKTSPLSVDKEHETGVFLWIRQRAVPDQPCKLHLQRFCKAQKALQAHFPAGYGAWYH